MGDRGNMETGGQVVRWETGNRETGDREMGDRRTENMETGSETGDREMGRQGVRITG